MHYKSESRLWSVTFRYLGERSLRTKARKSGKRSVRAKDRLPGSHDVMCLKFWAFVKCSASLEQRRSRSKVASTAPIGRTLAKALVHRCQSLWQNNRKQGIHNVRESSFEGRAYTATVSFVDQNNLSGH